MKKLSTVERMQQFLRSALKDNEIIVSPARNGTDYDFAVFANQLDHDKYKNESCDTELIQIWTLIPVSARREQIKKFGFSYWIHDEGVRYHKDGSGTPPSDDVVEHKETFASIIQLIHEVAQFIFESRLSDACESWNCYDTDLVEEQFNN